MINVLYSSLVVCFGLMFPQTKYEYDLLLLRQNDSLYFIYTCILHYYRMFSIPFKCTLYLLYTSRGVFIWRINYCHCHCVCTVHFIMIVFHSLIYLYNHSDFRQSLAVIISVAVLNYDI